MPGFVSRLLAAVLFCLTSVACGAAAANDLGSLFKQLQPRRSNGDVLIERLSDREARQYLNEQRKKKSRSTGASPQGAEGSAAGVQPSGKWTTLARQNGEGTTVCNTSGDLYSCFAFRCKDDRGLEFAFLTNTGNYKPNPIARLAVDDKILLWLQMTTIEEGRELVSGYGSQNAHSTLEALRAGRMFTIDIGYEHAFTLKGSDAGIDQTLKACGADRPDAATASAALPLNIEMLWDTGLDAVAYRDGRTDPGLSNLEFHQCEAFCLADNRCAAYTHERLNNNCSLFDAIGGRTRQSGSSSGIVTRNYQPPAPNKRPGRKVAFGKGLFWTDGDTRETYIRRIREAAEGFGAACETETRELDRLAETFNAGIKSSDAVAGSPTAVEWRGNTLASRIPVYLVASTPQPVRFEGKGMFALNADAVGPFGTGHRESETRAFVALHSRASDQQGSFEVVPLIAGDMEINLSLVAYLRACQREVVLAETRASLHVQPAAPRIVLNDPTAPLPYTKKMEAAAFGRTIHFDGKRFRISNTADNSEIIERDGSNIALSPTRRFLAAGRGGHFDIIDVVDGTAVATIGGSDIGWFNNDSFVVGDESPWGRTWLASTISPSVSINEQRTSCAICNSSADGMVNVDLENGIVAVAGPLGYALADLLDPEFRAVDPDLILADSEMKGITEFVRKQANLVGAVTRTMVDMNWNTPLGLSLTHMGEGRTTGSDYDAHNARLASLLIKQPVETVAQESRIAMRHPEAEAAVLRSVSGLGAGVDAASLRSRRTLLSGLREFGFVGAMEIQAEPTIPRIAEEQPGGMLQERRNAEQQSEKVRREIADDLRRLGRKVQWTSPPEGDNDIYCDAFNVSDDSDELPAALDTAYRIVSGSRKIWVLSSFCGGGATFGTLMSKSYLAVIDSQSAARFKTVGAMAVADAGTMGNSRSGAFQELDYRVKLAGDRYLVFYAPQASSIEIYDLESRKYAFQERDLPRGDLLKEAYLSADAKFVLQENVDGSFAIIRVADSVRLLQGRFIDDEIVFWNSSFQFDATAEGASYVFLRFPGEVGQFSLQQFNQRRLVPGLMKATLDGDARPEPSTLGLPPRIEARLEIAGQDIVGSATLVAQSAVRAIHLYQDGVRSQTIPVEPEATEVAIDARRQPASRWISLVAEDANGLLSLPVERDLGRDALPVVRLLAVGVDYYEDAALPPLDFAKSDAVSIYEALSKNAPEALVLASRQEDVLVDRRATKAAILEAAERLVRDTAPGETAIFFFAGHGLRGKQGDFFMGTSQTLLNDLEATSLAWDELASVLAKAKGRIIVLLDACHSGSANVDHFASNDDAVEKLRETTSTPLTVLAASKGRETSAEVDGSGVFSSALSRALTTDRAIVDANGNGSIEISELYRYVKSTVSARRNGLQTPWLSRSQIVGEMSIF